VALTGRADEQSTPTHTALRVLHAGTWFPADEVAKGAAYELFAEEASPGFLPNPRPGARYPHRRFVHATEVLAVTARAAAVATGEQPLTEPAEQPLRMPVSRAMDWGSTRPGRPRPKQPTYARSTSSTRSERPTAQPPRRASSSSTIFRSSLRNTGVGAASGRPGGNWTDSHRAPTE
jgi:hypothetical protein